MKLTRCCVLVKTDDLPLVSHAVAASGSEVIPSLVSREAATQRERIDQLSEHLVSHDCDWMVVGGGDGSINLAINAIYRSGRRMPLVIVPRGTGNDLVRNWIWPGDDEPTGESFVYPMRLDRFHDTDIAVVNLDGREPFVFANMLTLGSAADASREISEETKSRWGGLAYVLQAWRSVSEIENYPLRLMIDDEQLAVSVSNIFVANGRTCGGGFIVAPEAKVDNGQLDFIAIKEVTTWSMIDLTTKFFAGEHLEHEGIIHRRCSRLRIAGEAPQAITLDGEQMEATEIDIVVQPRSQSILVSPLDQLLTIGPALNVWGESQSSVELES